MFDFNEVQPEDMDRLKDGDVRTFTVLIQPGNYSDLFKGLPDNIATQSESGAIYINLKLVDDSNNFLYDRIGIYSPKGPKYTNMGRKYIRRMIDSNFGLSSDDASDEAIAKRKIANLSVINGMRIQVKVKKGEKYMEVDKILTPDDPEYVPF